MPPKGSRRTGTRGVRRGRRRQRRVCGGRRKGKGEDGLPAIQCLRGVLRGHPTGEFGGLYMAPVLRLTLLVLHCAGTYT